jgi:uncharacterized protein
MNTSLVIDSSVYFTYALYGKLNRLFSVIVNRNLVIYIDDNIIRELEKNFAKKIKLNETQIAILIEQLKEITLQHKTDLYFSTCPDPKDNFLFDIAIQTNSEVIVTQEKALLQWKESPVIVHDLKWFKEKYPTE